MAMSSYIFSKYLEYCQTQDFVQGLFVEITGILIELVVFSLIASVIIYCYHQIKTRQLRSMIDFYILQIFNKINDILLDMSSIEDVMEFLFREMANNKSISIFKHNYYGMLENILFVLKNSCLKDNRLRENIKNKTINDFNRYLDISVRCLDELDRITMIASGVVKAQEDLFRIRILIYSLRDIIERVISKIEKSDGRPLEPGLMFYDVIKWAENYTEIAGVIFTKRRKLIDSILINKKRISIARMLLMLPYVALRRFVELRLCKLLRKPYKDFMFPSQYPEIIQGWRSKNGFTIEQAAKFLGLEIKEYKDYERGYRQPDVNVLEVMLPHINQCQQTKE